MDRTCGREGEAMMCCPSSNAPTCFLTVEPACRGRTMDWRVVITSKRVPGELARANAEDAPMQY
jgi:hypothetical protein